MVTSYRSALALSLLVSAFLFSPARATVGEQKELAPGAEHEVCLELQIDDKLDYGFSATAPLAFNLHYHDGDKIYYPLYEESLLERHDSFTAPLTQTFCLMWRNASDKPIDLEIVIGGD